MTTPEDMALVRLYATHRSEESFATLVSRHVNLVHSVAFRQLGDPHLAEEVTQATFIILARKAGSLSPKTIVSAWLCRTAQYLAARALRDQHRRQLREQEAYMQSLPAQPAPESSAWLEIAPLLDAAMARLDEKDHAAIVLRFFDGKDMQRVGAALGVNENAAKTRVSRAVEKLRKFFAKRGVTLSAAAIAGAISANSIQAAPSALAKTVTTLALAKSVAVPASTLAMAKGALKFMAWTKTQTAIASAVIIGAVVYSVIQHQAQAGLRKQSEALQQQVARLQAENERLAARSRVPTPRLPAPQVQLAAMPATNTAPTAGDGTTNWYGRLKDKEIKLTRDQVESFLSANGRNAANLLAAFRTSGDPGLLKEAEEKYPGDPAVDFEAAAYQILHSNDVTPEDQRKWLDAFEKSDPNNSMANYLSAINYFNSGQIDQGLQDLAAASGKSLNDYSINRSENDMEAYLASGYSVADAEQLGTSGLLLPQLGQMKQLAQDIADLAGAYKQTGDPASAQSVLQMADNLGQQYATPTPGESMISQLVGIAIERIALNALDPTAPYGNNGLTVHDALNQLQQQRQTIQQINDQVVPYLPSLSDQDLIIYKNRWMMLGEANAQQWVLNKYAQQ